MDNGKKIKIFINVRKNKLHSFGHNEYESVERGGIIMPELKCTVQTCVHNQQYLCDLDKIQVGGENAKNPQETCCDSFQERKEGSYGNSMNSMHEASDRSAIDCKATNCMYNEQCKCHAGKISVEGGSARTADGTECATFQCHCG